MNLVRARCTQRALTSERCICHPEHACFKELVRFIRVSELKNDADTDQERHSDGARRARWRAQTVLRLRNLRSRFALNIHSAVPERRFLAPTHPAARNDGVPADAQRSRYFLSVAVQRGCMLGMTPHDPGLRPPGAAPPATTATSSASRGLLCRTPWSSRPSESNGSRPARSEGGSVLSFAALRSRPLACC